MINKHNKEMKDHNHPEEKGMNKKTSEREKIREVRLEAEVPEVEAQKIEAEVQRIVLALLPIEIILLQATVLASLDWALKQQNKIFKTNFLALGNVKKLISFMTNK